MIDVLVDMLSDAILSVSLRGVDEVLAHSSHAATLCDQMHNFPVVPGVKTLVNRREWQRFHRHCNESSCSRVGSSQPNQASFTSPFCSPVLSCCCP